jgi:hypothetical protein
LNWRDDWSVPEEEEGGDVVGSRHGVVQRVVANLHQNKVKRQPREIMCVSFMQADEV